MLDDLEQQLTPAEARARERALQEARDYVANAIGAHGVNAVHRRSFPRRKPRGDNRRIDIEVITGRIDP
jgi:hypothetical protein